jgi:hypothetical protein
MIQPTRFLGAAVAILSAVGGTRADTFYVVVYGAQSIPQRPKYSHSWATFVRVPDGSAGSPPAAPQALEIFTISWMPCKIELTPNRLLPEPGTNLELSKTFQAVLAHCEHISAFGPYQIDEWLFCRAKGYLRELQSGEVRYKTIDTGYKPLKVSNCIHALTSFDREHVRVRIGRTNFGEVASYFVTETYRVHMICSGQTHCWIADVLGLGQYPIQWRTIDQGRPNPRAENRNRGAE